jgi:magnesium transporter
VGRERTEPVHIDVIDYDASDYRETRVAAVEDCFPYRDSPTQSWINVTGIHDSDVVQRLGEHFGIHPLHLEDIVNTGHRPTLDESDHYVLVVLKMLYADREGNGLVSEQVSILFGPHWVLSFQETSVDVFDIIRQRIQKTAARVRSLWSEYLAYSLIDAIVDHY